MSNINNSNLIQYSQKFSNIVRNNNKELNENKDFNKNHFNHISLKNNIIKPDYKGANIISFLSFLNNTICIPQNLRIVCHSHIMQKIIKDLNITPNNNIKSILKENLWSIFMSLNNGKKISISRHGFSFANLIKEKKTLLGKIEQHLEKDAKLSLYGILTALLHGSDLVEKELSYGMTEKPQTIYVSVLIRTWMTAICLYLPHCITDGFTLVVSPFLKEEGLGLDNEPESFENQIISIGNFLNYLIKIPEGILSKKIINENLLKIKTYFIQKRKLIVYAKYGEKIIEVKFFYVDGRKRISYEYNNTKDYKYFNENCSTNKNFNIDNIEIFHGEIKPLKDDIKKKFTRWCEPFSKKSSFSFSNTKSMCKKRLTKKTENIVVNNTESIVFNNNNGINLTHRNAVYGIRPNENLKFLNLKNPENNNNIKKYLEEERIKKLQNNSKLYNVPL